MVFPPGDTFGQRKCQQGIDQIMTLSGIFIGQKYIRRANENAKRHGHSLIARDRFCGVYILPCGALPDNKNAAEVFLNSTFIRHSHCLPVYTPHYLRPPPRDDIGCKYWVKNTELLLYRRSTRLTGSLLKELKINVANRRGRSP